MRKWARQSLEAITRKRINDDILELLGNKCDGQYGVLVLDPRGAKVLSASMTLSQVMESHDVAMVENLYKKRQPLEGVPALYFVEPSEKSVDAIIADFTGKEFTYSAALLVFTTKLSDVLAQKLSGSTGLRRRMLCCVEAHVDYLAVESHVASLSMEHPCLSIYNLEGNVRTQRIKVVTRRILSILLSLHERPYVRIAGKSPVARDVGNCIAADLASLWSEKQGNSAWYWGDGGDDKETGRHGGEHMRGTLLVVDRSCDVTAALVHEFTYEAMLHDLLPEKEKGSMISDPNDASKCLEPNSSDPFWLQLRHMHISEVSETLHDALLRVARSGAFTYRKDGSSTPLKTAELFKILRTMPEYKKTWEQYQIHTHFALLLSKTFKARDLQVISDLEQTIVSFVTDDAKVVKSTAALIKFVVGKLKDAIAVDKWRKEDIIRVLLIFLAEIDGVTSSEWESLVNVCERCLPVETLRNLPSRIKKLLTLESILLQSEAASGKRLSHSKKTLAYHIERQKKNRYITRTRQPWLARTLDAIAMGTINQNDFPYADSSETPSKDYRHGRRPRSTRKKFIAEEDRSSPGSKDDLTEEKTGGRGEEEKIAGQAAFEGLGSCEPRIIVYIAGGATRSECRMIYEKMRLHRREIVLVIPNFLKPADVIEFCSTRSVIKA